MNADQAIDHKGREPEEAVAARSDILMHAAACRTVEERLRESNRQLRQLWTALQGIREEERRRMARELHDELGQKLVGLKLDLAWLADNLKSDGGRLSAKVRAMSQQMEDTVRAVRQICNGLRPALLDDLGLAAAMDWLATDFSRRTGIRVELAASAAEGIDDEAMATAIFRITQECLTNVAKHARATRVAVSLANPDSRLELRVTDNGTGAAAFGGDGLGLTGIRERALMLGGWARVSSSAGEGTVVVVSLPISPE